MHTRDGEGNFETKPKFRKLRKKRKFYGKPHWAAFPSLTHTLLNLLNVVRVTLAACHELVKGAREKHCGENTILLRENHQIISNSH